MKALGFLLVVILIYLIIQLIMQGINRISSKKENTGRISTEKIVQCAYCKVHLPKKEALATDDDNIFYCSEEHRKIKDEAS